jgi:paraquat-inducible protein A
MKAHPEWQRDGHVVSIALSMEARLIRIFSFVLLALAALCLILGIALPIMRFETLYFFEHEPSLLQVIGGLWTDDSQMLAVLVLVLSVLFPAAKLIVLGVDLGRRGGRAKWLRRMIPHLSKWSMMDVMLVAIVIFAAKTSGLAKAVTLPGLWFYAASAVMAAIFPSVVKLGKMRSRMEKR